MAIKRISLRGISRTPSDRMTSDGGCAESLNVHLEDNELAPSLEPRDITESVGLPTGLKYDILYLHKTTSYSNYICKYAQSVGAKWTQSEDYVIPDSLADKNWLTDPSLLDGPVTEQSDGTYQVLLNVSTAPDYFIADSEGNWYRVDNVKGGDDSSCLVVCSYGGKLEHAWVLDAFLTLNEDETIQDVTSIGNTIIISTSTRMYYALYKDGAYHGLGEKIPEPMIEFRTIGAYASNASTVKEFIELYTDRKTTGTTSGHRQDSGITTSTTQREESGADSDAYDNIYGLEQFAWEYGINGGVRDDVRTAYLTSMTEIAEKIVEATKAVQNRWKKNKVFCSPVMVRYALRLYDGTYIYQSVPILLGAGASYTMTVEGTRSYNQSTNVVNTWMKVFAENTFSVNAILHSISYEQWLDVVDSVDVFLSTDINYPDINSLKFSKIESIGTSSTTNSSSQTVTLEYFRFYRMDKDITEDEQRKNEILSKRNFYKVASFPCRQLEKILNGYGLLKGEEDSDLRYQDKLVLCDELTDDEAGGKIFHPSNLMTYNSRLIGSGFDVTLSSGHPYLQSTAINPNADESTSALSQLIFRYYVRDSAGETHTVLSRNPEGVCPLSDSYSADVYVNATYSGRTATTTTKTLYSRPFGFLAFPDSRCYKMRIHSGTLYVDLELEPHPGLNCAYYYGDVTKTLQTLISERVKEQWGNVRPQESADGFIAEGEEKTYKDSEMVIVSSSGNPFYFPLSGRFHFTGDIRGLATTTRALSTGQFGQFPLYVFTTDGIWAMTTKDDGSFSKATPVSREVALDRRVFPIDQAVVFITEKGVKMLSGSDTTDLSPNMNGRHWVVEDDAETLLNKYDSWYRLLPSLKDTTPFMAFMATAECMYDYTGARLIFFNGTADYQYVYMLTTGTWHKTMQDIDSPYKICNALNSYPNCQACALDEESSETIALDFSTPLDVTSEDERRCIIATRPFDLDEPDILKTINHLKIRGQYERYDANNKPRVSYMLFGSQDGNTFHRLTSLRGKSWKLFRIIILATLKPTERISWIDVDYESRFNNRLR